MDGGSWEEKQNGEPLKVQFGDLSKHLLSVWIWDQEKVISEAWAMQTAAFFKHIKGAH